MNQRIKDNGITSKKSELTITIKVLALWESHGSLMHQFQGNSNVDTSHFVFLLTCTRLIESQNLFRFTANPTFARGPFQHIRHAPKEQA